MRELTTKQVKAFIDSQEPYVLLDSRGVDYFLWEHLPGAINLRYKHMADRAAAVLPDTHARIITYCDGFTCGASTQGYKNLEHLGYTNLWEYSGGIADWKAHGLKTVEDTRYKLAPNVYRFPEQLFFGEPVGCYLIVEDNCVVLVDGPQQLTEEHEDFIAHFDRPVVEFLTHGPTAGEGKLLQERLKAKIYLHTKDARNEWLTVTPDVLFDDGYLLNDHLCVIHVPGHTPGSAVLLDTKNKLLLSGDHIQGTKTGKIRDFIRNDDGISGDPRQRLTSVEKLLPYDFGQILPFHYEMIQTNAKKAVEEFIGIYRKNKGVRTV